jgi:hypothetical protein
VVDTPFTSLVIDIKVLKIVVEINTTSTQVSSEQGSVGSENGSDVDMPLSTEGNSETSLPFVEMSNDGSLGFSASKLLVSCAKGEWKLTHLSKEPCDNVSKDDSFIGLVVVGRRGDTSEVPEISLPLVQPARQL